VAVNRRVCQHTFFDLRLPQRNRCWHYCYVQKERCSQCNCCVAKRVHTALLVQGGCDAPKTRLGIVLNHPHYGLAQERTIKSTPEGPHLLLKPAHVGLPAAGLARPSCPAPCCICPAASILLGDWLAELLRQGRVVLGGALHPAQLPRHPHWTNPCATQHDSRAQQQQGSSTR
jgi:hypothetical protein